MGLGQVALATSAMARTAPTEERPVTETTPVAAPEERQPAASRTRRAVALIGHPTARPFWTLVGIRVAFLVGTALTFLWEPIDQTTGRDLTTRAWEARSDLLFNTFAHWDSGWYMLISREGYTQDQAAAFFPLYPLTIHAVEWVTRSTVAAGVLVALISAGIGSVCVHALARDTLDRRVADESVILLALYPLAFVFTAVYSEGLFLALAAGSLLAARRGHGLVAALLGAAAVATRPVGLALLPALLILAWRGGEGRRRVLDIGALALLPAALGAYALYLQHRLGNARAFVDAQADFWLRHTPTLGPLGGLWDATNLGARGGLQILLHLPRDMAYAWPEQSGARNLIQLALLAATIALTVVAWRRLGTAFAVYYATYLALLLSTVATGFPLVSFPRFVLGDFPLFIALASLLVEHPRARTITLVTFGAVGAVAGVAFSRVFWVA